MINSCIYFVEGACEEKLINALKEPPEKLLPGKVRVLNVIQNEIPRSILLAICHGTKVVLVFDTDVPYTEQLKKNLVHLKKYCSGIKVIYLAQVLTIEDERVRCTDVSRLRDLTRSKSDSDFKRDFCALKDCRSLLERHNLNIKGLWVKEPPETFQFVVRNANQIKVS